MIEATLAFHLSQIAMLDVVAPGSAFDELEKVAQIFAFRGLQLREFNSHPKRGAALGNDSGQDEPFDPNLSIGQPETNFYVHSRRYGCSRFDETSAQPRVGQVSPDRNG